MPAGVRLLLLVVWSCALMIRIFEAGFSLAVEGEPREPLRKGTLMKSARVETASRIHETNM
jgi:hypothetical protein